MRLQNKLILASATVSGALALSSCSQQSTTEAHSPNLLYIFPDQYRLSALGIWSNPEYREFMSTISDPVQTPNLDKLAKEGVVFNQACSMFPLSSPHRGMMMSGMYSEHNGLDSNARTDREDGLRHDIDCFTDVLAQVGYETAYVGKTHWEKNEPLFDENDNYVGTTEAPGGHALNRYDTFIPEGRGRHSVKLWFQNLKDIHFDASSYSNRPEWVGGKKDGEPYRAKQFATTQEANLIIDYLKNDGGELRDASKPFGLIWSINPPHNPYSKESDCEAEEFAKFKDMSFDELLVRENVVVKNAKDKKRLELTAKVYYSLISSVDREIGRVMDALEANGLKDNTVVVFTSDHGEMMGSHAKMGKPQIYDEAYLIPFIIRYPAKVAHRIEDLKMNSIDIMPTMLGMLGYAENIPATVDGRDYSAGIISGDFSTCEKPVSSVYRDFTTRGVRTDDYTYRVHPNGDYDLYDLKADPYQMHSLKLQDIPAASAKLLKDELGFWLNDGRDSWAEKRLNSELINY